MSPTSPSPDMTHSPPSVETCPPLRAVTVSKGRLHPDTPCPLRNDFQRDIDRIIHAKSFRRLIHKTQVFLNPEGDHYRTRMAHTLEVTRIARTMARALGLNEDVTEAVGLAHDLGHTPFGHAGEKALASIVPGGFSHNAQSLRVVDVLERGYLGLNLTHEVRDGILHHTGDEPASTLEGQLVAKADRIAYLSSDIDDAIRAGILSPTDIPAELSRILGETHSQRVDTLVRDIVSHTRKVCTVSTSPEVTVAMDTLRDFLFERVYKNPVAKGEESKAQDILLKLFDYYLKHPDALPEDVRARLDLEGEHRAVCDYIAGMTDRFAVSRFDDLFIPKGWNRV